MIPGYTLNWNDPVRIKTRSRMMEIQVEIGPQAKEEIYGALAADPIENVALVVFVDEKEECCGVGFEVILADEKEVPPVVYLRVGESNGWPVYMAEELVPSDSGRLMINVDRANSRLAALFIGTEVDPVPRP